MTTTLTLPWPPSVNHYWRHTRAGQHYISEKGKAFRLEVWAECRRLRVRRMRADVALVIELSPPDRRRRDSDNPIKSLFDALVHGGLMVDDDQVQQFHVYRLPPTKGGRCIVKAREIECVAPPAYE